MAKQDETAAAAEQEQAEDQQQPQAPDDENPEGSSPDAPEDQANEPDPAADAPNQPEVVVAKITTLKAPEGAATFSTEGHVYEVVKGEITVLVEHVAAAIEHGFKTIESVVTGK